MSPTLIDLVWWLRRMRGRVPVMHLSQAHRAALAEAHGLVQHFPATDHHGERVQIAKDGCTMLETAELSLTQRLMDLARILGDERTDEATSMMTIADADLAIGRARELSTEARRGGYPPRTCELVGRFAIEFERALNVAGRGGQPDRRALWSMLPDMEALRLDARAPVRTDIQRKPLSERAKRLYAELLNRDPHDTWPVPKMRTWLADRHKDVVEETDLRKRVIPELESWGVIYKRHIGCYLPQECR